MNGKIPAVILIGAAALAGAGVWYSQVYAYYHRLPVTERIALTTPDGDVIAAPIRDFQGIDAESSPLRYRGCFTITPAEADVAQMYDAAAPLNGPGWFDCYSAAAIGADLESGAAVAYLSQQNIHPGVDRVVAVYPDGRGFVWHQLNESAEEKKVIE